MTGPRGGAAARVARVVAVYLAVGAVLWAALPSVQRTFLLPALFGILARGALVAGLPVAAVLAWRYPRLGGGGGEGDGEG